MNKMEILIIISALLLPVNLYCSFWIFREVLNLSGITFREMLKDLNGLAIPSGRFGKGMRRRQKILLNYLLKRSYEPEKTQMLFRRYKHSVTPSVIAVILTDYIAFSKNTNKISVAIVGIAVLLIFNIALALYGKIYKKNHPLDNEILAIVERKKKNTYGIGIVGSIVAIIIALVMYIGCFLLVAAVAQVPSTEGQQSNNQPKDIQQLTNIEEDYISGDRLDESLDISASESETILDISLKTTDEEKATIQSECIVISELYREIYQQAEKVPSQYFGAEDNITQKTRDEIENILITAGYSVINSDSVYPEYLEHSDCVNAFWECVKQQTDAEVSFWGVSSTGGLYYRKFCFIGGKSYGIFAGADWKEDGKLELSYAAKREIFYWDMTYNADFIYRDLYLDRHWEAAHLLRLHPVDQPMYDLTMKYILPIGYHNVNLFLLDWSSDDYGNLCFNDLLDCLYRLKYNDYLYARDYPRYTTPYSYIAIPAKLFEDTIFPYFDISMEEFREKALYDAENDIYPWQDISCNNVLYYPSLIPEVTECIEIDESTKKLIVNVMCPDYQTDKLFVHEVTIRVLSDGEYQYIGNQITYKSDIDIPSPQARIPVQRFSVDNDN